MDRIAAFLRGLDLRATAAVLFGSIAIVGLVGIVTRLVDPGNPWFDLDSELDLLWPPGIASVALPAVWSSLLFAFAGLSWIAVGWARRRDRKWLAAGVFGAVLLFLAADELFSIHERIEHGSGLDWQLLYLPIAALAAGLLLALAWWTRHEARGAAAMLIVAGASWMASFVLELLQWRGDEQIGIYPLLMVPEELLELTGTALCILAAITVLQATLPDVAQPDSGPTAASEDDEPPRQRHGRSGLLAVAVLVGSMLFVWLAISLVEARGESETDLFLDVYELTGSRLSGLISMAGVALLTAAAAIALFAASVSRPRAPADPRPQLLLWVGLLTALLAIDDYLAVHELADDVLQMLTGIEAERILKNVLELLVLGTYGLLFAIVLWRYRVTVAASQWLLLAGAGVFLAGSLVMDMAPHSWLAETIGISLDGQALVEDTLKLAGIALYLAYVTGLAASTVRQSK